ncbi:MAG: tripeptide aminopeptidase PepT, partial [Candidatus Eisenbacteria bacterium]
ASREIPRGPIRVVFTCDEEVGRGTAKIDLKEVNASVAYTLDGGSAGAIENETFSADLATVTITGYNIHPGLATGKMINSIRLTGQFLSRMPWHRLAPETTAGREPFLHPYVLEGGVAESKIKVLLRSFVTKDLAKQAKILREIAATIEAEHPKAKVEVDVKTQYRNMGEYLVKEPRAVKLATEAVKKIGVKPLFEAIRGGTDGSRLSEMGLPTPNLFCGMHNFHSTLEYACLEEMELSVRTLIELAQLWAKEKRRAA